MKTRPANPSHSARRSKNRRRFGRGLRRRKPGGGAAKSPNRTVVRMKSKLLVWRRGTLAHSKGSTKASAQKLNTQRKKQIGGAGALERLHGKSESPAAPNPSSKGEPAHGCVVAGGRREHEAKIDSGGASQTENENREKDGAQLRKENANEADGA
jgi:hypothetical protein